MNDADLLRTVSVEMPTVSDRVRDLIAKNLRCQQHEMHEYASRCSTTVLEPAPFPVALAIIAILRGCGCDDCLDTAATICRNCGESLASSTLSTKSLSRMEQAQASERDQIEHQRLVLWFYSIIQDRISRSQLREIESHAQHLSFDFVTDPFEQLQFDAGLQEKERRG